VFDGKSHSVHHKSSSRYHVQRNSQGRVCLNKTKESDSLPAKEVISEQVKIKEGDKLLPTMLTKRASSLYINGNRLKKLLAKNRLAKRNSVFDVTSTNAEFGNKNILFAINKNNTTLPIGTNILKKRHSRSKKAIIKQNNTSANFKHTSLVKISGRKYKNTGSIIEGDTLQATAKRKLLHYRANKQQLKASPLKSSQENSHQGIFNVKPQPLKLSEVKNPSNKLRVILNIQRTFYNTNENDEEEENDNLTTYDNDKILKPIFTLQ